MTTLLEGGAVPHLVDMVTAEHAVMQNEALMALALLAEMRLSDAEPSLIEAKIGRKLETFLTDFGPSLPCEIIQNVLTLIKQLTVSGKVNG